MGPPDPKSQSSSFSCTQLLGAQNPRRASDGESSTTEFPSSNWAMLLELPLPVAT